MKYVESFSEGSGTEQALISGSCYQGGCFVLVVSDDRCPGEGKVLGDSNRLRGQDLQGGLERRGRLNQAEQHVLIFKKRLK